MVKEREARLFERWRAERGYSCFMTDGVFDEETWSRQRLKITFILKEANWPGGNQDLCQYLLKDSSRNAWSTWNNIARWTAALLQGEEYPEHISQEMRVEYLRKISFLNLKKVGGGSSTDHDELRKYARADALYIREQLLLYCPDIIICCGKWVVADILEREVLAGTGGMTVQDREELDGIPVFYTRFPGKERLTPVVSFRHPQKRYTGHGQWREWYAQMKEVREVFLPSDQRFPEGLQISRSPEEVEGTGQISREKQETGVSHG